MPDFPIIDTHVHLWNVEKIDYPWLGEVPPLNKTHRPEDFTQACGPVEVEGMIFLQADAEEEENHLEAQWVSHLAQHDPRIKGIVARASLEQGEAVRQDLDMLSQNPLVKGIRRLIQGETDPDFCLQYEFVQGVKMVHNYGMHFELCIYHHQLASVLKLVAQCPEVSFNLNHIGKPGIEDGLKDPWREEIAALAEFDNMSCKISGMANEADMQHWTDKDLRPYIHHVIEQFGFDRVMFGGDWPVSTLATDYPRWVNTVEQAVAGCSYTELRNLFVDNAKKFYRL
jgi:L-fuconolactonase